jgi:hypothetical protein
MHDLRPLIETEPPRRALKWNWGLIALVLLAALAAGAARIVPEIITP